MLNAREFYLTLDGVRVGKVAADDIHQAARMVKGGKLAIVGDELGEEIDLRVAPDLLEAAKLGLYALSYYEKGATNCPKNDSEELEARVLALRKLRLAIQSAGVAL